MRYLRGVLIAIGVAGLIAATILMGGIQSQRRSNGIDCTFSNDCSQTSYGPAIFVAILSVVCIIVGAKMVRSAHSSAGS